MIQEVAINLKGPESRFKKSKLSGIYRSTPGNLKRFKMLVKNFLRAS